MLVCRTIEYDGECLLHRRLVRRFYRKSRLRIPPLWDLKRKHIRLQLRNGAWVKSGCFYEGIDETALRRLCIRLAPVKVYMSVLDFLHPEIFEAKCKLHHSTPASIDRCLG